MEPHRRLDEGRIEEAADREMDRLEDEAGRLRVKCVRLRSQRDRLIEELGRTIGYCEHLETPCRVCGPGYALLDEIEKEDNDGNEE